MKFFSKKNKTSQNSNDNKDQDQNIIDIEIQDNKSEIIVDDSIKQSENKNINAVGKIEPIKVEATKANISQNEDIKVSEDSEVKEKKEKIKSEFEEKVDKVIDSVAQLFAPFKDLMIKIVPKSKIIIKILDLFAIMIIKITKFIILRYPTFIKILKSKFFKIVVLFIIFMFLFGTIFSKIINSSYYVSTLENSIYKSTGYKAKINGYIKVYFMPNFSIALKNVNFYLEDNVNPHNSQFKVNQFGAANLNIKFKLLPLFIGNFSIKSIDIIGATLDLQTADQSSITESSYTKIVADVEKSIKSTISLEKINEIEAKNKASSSLDSKYKSNENISKESLALLDNLENLIKGEVDSIKDNDSSFIKNFPLKEEPKDKVIQQKENEEYQEEIIEEKINKDNQEDTSLIAPKKASDILNYSFLSSFLSLAVDNIKFSFNDVDIFSLRRSKINIINKEGQKLITIDNINSKVSSSLMGKVSSEGRFRFADNNINYVSTIDYQKDQINFDIDFSFVSDSNDVIKVQGFKHKDTSNISADITVQNQGILTFINKFLVDINSKKIKNSDFTAKLFLNSNLFKIHDIRMSLNEDIYNGSFVWDFSGSDRKVIIDLIASMDNFSDVYKGINDNISKSIIRGSYFLSAVEEIINWKNSKMNVFRSNYFVVNFKIKDTKINDIKINRLSIGFLINNLNKLYLYDFNIKTQDYDANISGRLDLDNKSAIVAVDAKGQISSSTQTLGFNPKTTEFLQSIAKNKDNYAISTKLRLESNKLLFTDFVGNLGDMRLHNTYIILTERVGDSDIVVSTKIDELNLSDISDIYNKQISNLTYEKIEDVNIFGLPDNFKIKMDVEIKKSSIRGVPFKNITLDMSLFKTGFTINKFNAIGEKGGVLTASISADSAVLPVIAGHINLENLVLRFEDSKDLFFKNSNLVGNVVLNGKVRFNGDTYATPFSSIDGDISFIKQERISVNRFANIDGLFLTLTQKQSNGKDSIFVNDIYGRANIKNSIIELYPIALLYINKGKDYRGLSQVMIDLSDGTIQGEGTGDMTSDTSNKLKFDISGNFLNPKVNKSFFKGTKSSVGVKPIEKEISLINNKTHKVVDNLNNPNDKNNFKNTYNSNIQSKSYDQLKVDLYADLLEDNSKGQVKYPNSQNRKPGSGAVTKNQDNTTYYGVN